MSLQRSARLRWALYVLILLLSITFFASKITSRAVDRDAQQSLRMAVNLAHHGVISLSGAAPYAPSQYREPIPVLVSAGMIAASDAVQGRTADEDFFSGARLRLVKMQNLGWLALLLLGVFWAIEMLHAGWLTGLLAAAFTLFTLDRNADIFNDLYSDLPAAAVLMLASVALAGAVSRRSLRLAACAGLWLGVMCLIKAAMLYVFMGLLLCVGVYFVAQRAHEWRTRSAVLAGFLAGFALIVAPWSIRNYVQLGTFQLTQRAGVVLLVRALKDQMTHTEYVGSFYVWAPPRIRDSVGRWLGFGPDDLRRGGRLQHLNRDPLSEFAADDYQAELQGRPDLAISYYRRARAERVKLTTELEAAGDPSAGVTADQRLQRRAMSLIEAHPIDHLAATAPFMWRGAPRCFPLLLLTLLIAWRMRREDLGFFALPAFGLVMFYALLSHFIPRYSIPAEPVTAVAAACLILLAARAIRTRWRARAASS